MRIVYPRAIVGLAAATLAVLFLPTVARSFLSTRPDWPITDLLINYRAGFVRRGLIGEVMLWICNTTGMSFFHLAAGLFAVIYAGLILMMVRLVWPLRDRFPILAAMLLLSPALLLFPVHEYPAYLRKESFFIAILLMHALVIRRFLSGKMEYSHLRAFHLWVLTPVLTMNMFIHEAQVFFLAAPFLMTYLAVRQRAKGAWWLLGLYAVPTVVALVLLQFKGSPAVIPEIAASVGHLVPLKKGREGAIAALGWPMSEFYRVSLNSARHFPAFYLVTWTLSVVIPAVALCRILRRHAEDDAGVSGRGLATCVALICLAPLPLAFVMSDYGRWIHLTAFSVVAFLLAIPIRQPDLNESTDTRFWSGPVAAMVALAYVGLWMLPHYLSPGTPNREYLRSGLARSGYRVVELVLKGKVHSKTAQPLPSESLAHTPQQET